MLFLYYRPFIRNTLAPVQTEPSTTESMHFPNHAVKPCKLCGNLELAVRDQRHPCCRRHVELADPRRRRAIFFTIESTGAPGSTWMRVVVALKERLCFLEIRPAPPAPRILLKNTDLGYESGVSVLPIPYIYTLRPNSTSYIEQRETL